MQNKARLKEDIKSYKRDSKKKDIFYGYKDDIVTIIALHGNMYIVEGKERFSVDKLKLEILN
jgi:hypothetical protein